MVSSWIQLLRVRSTDAGVYSCTVVSKKGIVRAEARVQVVKVNISFLDGKNGSAAGSVGDANERWAAEGGFRWDIQRGG